MRTHQQETIDTTVSLAASSFEISHHTHCSHKATKHKTALYKCWEHASCTTDVQRWAPIHWLRTCWRPIDRPTDHRRRATTSNNLLIDGTLLTIDLYYRWDLPRRLMRCQEMPERQPTIDDSRACCYTREYSWRHIYIYILSSQVHNSKHYPWHGSTTVHSEFTMKLNS